MTTKYVLVAFGEMVPFMEMEIVPAEERILVKVATGVSPVVQVPSMLCQTVREPNRAWAMLEVIGVAPSEVRVRVRVEKVIVPADKVLVGSC